MTKNLGKKQLKKLNQSQAIKKVQAIKKEEAEKAKKKQPEKVVLKEKKKRVFVIRFGLGKERDYLVENLSMLISAGMDVVDSLKTIQLEVRTRGMKKLINQMVEEIEAGSPIWKALKKSKLFSEHIISLIKIGESASRLSENLKAVSLQQQKNRILKSRIRAAMGYPVLVIGLSLVVGIGISWFILPRFVGLFLSLKQELPVMTKGLVWVGQILLNHGIYLVPGLLVGIALTGYFFFIQNKTKVVGQWIFFNIPITKRLVQEIELSRFGYILGSLLGAGLPIEEALEALENSTTFYSYKKLYRSLRTNIFDGKTFLQSFQLFRKTKKMVPPSIQQMIQAGERSGKLSKSFLKVGATYEVKTEISAKNLTTILEPILLIIIGIGVLVIALSIITPIYGLLGNMG